MESRAHTVNIQWVLLLWNKRARHEERETELCIATSWFGKISLANLSQITCCGPPDLFSVYACLPPSFKACGIFHVFGDSKILLHSLVMAKMIGADHELAVGHLGTTYAVKSSMLPQPQSLTFSQPRDPSHLIV